MNKTKMIILGAISIVIVSIIIAHKSVQIRIEKEEKRIEEEKATPTEIENVTLYEKNQVLKLLKEEYPEDEFEIICYLSDINKSPSKWSPSSRKVGKKFMVRPNGQVGEEFLVEYYDDDEDKFFATPIEPIITAYYKDEETVETRRVNDMVEEYVQPILDEILEGKERFKDYNAIYSTSGIIDLEWFKIIESIDDYFYTYPNDGYFRYQKVINILIYINEDEFNEEELYFYYDCFQSVSNELIRKINYEISNIEEYDIYIKLFKLEDEEFNNIKTLDSQTLNILQSNKWRNNDFYKYYKEISIEDGEVMDKNETSYESFQKVW